ncbi:MULTISPECIES: glycosyltransferase [unclassified Nodularia (in: cyanobacteria)]|uniref:glycosyltransferase n=1 Tax=unclassified Nodularia (in: cyanobacteria) TaxID=2656917 RepID=UPI00187EDDCB|nr:MULTISPECIES: glycosyltransferase [unclassified Nodularia (in: cyanobacteria)]MBE9200214.1 glycosyltransferase [Nodularia sp. LEGE 06071]MCC2694255.1 glycosyltransferase [Nodularia sp. LEGE 04288]
MLFKQNNLQDIVSLLKCSKCHNDHLVIKTDYLECSNCSAQYPIRNKVPIFLENTNTVKIMPIDHISNQLPMEIFNWLEKLNGYSLNIGAGATKSKIPKCIELEYSIWKNTAVVGDAHHLPFQDEIFDAVVCFNVFEHLYNPALAAKEILRVLKPGGKLILQTAFLQPLHEEPIHFYNATKYGLLNWFSEFKIEKCHVSENFNPALTLGWLSSELIHSLNQNYNSSISTYLSKTTLQDWSKIWADPDQRNGLLWDSLLNLPQSSQEKFSAGFELEASKPSKIQMLKPIENNTTKEASMELLNQNSSVKIAQLPDESINEIDEKRLLVISRLESATICEKMGNNPWQTISNTAYESSENPCITVIISLYNYSKYICKCIDSVCKSNLYDLPGDIEVLIIDDCSTDSSASIVEEYIKEAKIPISLIKKYFNTGLADVRNIGLKLARSPYVFILDADNWILPNCLPVLYREIKLSDCAATYGKIRRFDNETNQDIDTVSSKEWDVSSLVKDPYIDAMAMFNREILLKVGGYSTELIEYGWFGWEDYDLWLKLAQNGYSCQLVPEILSSYRLHPTSMINITGRYILNMSRYFHNKFSELSQLNTQSDRLFGSWRSEVYSGTYGKIRPRLNAVQSDELHKANATIEAIQSSKFWKLRNQWFKLKKNLGLTKDIGVKI